MHDKLKRIEVDIDDLILDPNNPRHKNISGQSEIIEYMIENEKILNLAKDIAKHGLNPTDNILVRYESKNKKYYVLEGNRRVTALKILNDLDLVPEKKLSQYLQINVNSQINLTKVPVIVGHFDRDEMGHWIALRHNGQQNGVGAKEWDAEQKTRHFANNNNALALTLIDYAKSKGYIPVDKKVKNLTTATRYLSNPDFRATLGLKSNVKDSEIRIDVPLKEFDRVIKKFISDLVDENEGLPSKSKVQDRENYRKQLIAEQKAPQNKAKEQIIELNKASGVKALKDSSRSLEKKTPAVKQSTRSIKRKSIVTENFEKNWGEDKILEKIVREAKTINSNKFPSASMFLCRVIFERSLKSAYYKRFEESASLPNHKIIEKLVSKIEEDTTSNTNEQHSRFQKLGHLEKNALDTLKNLRRNDTFSFTSLGDYVHAKNTPIASDQTMTEWDNLEPIILYLLRYAYQRNTGHK